MFLPPAPVLIWSATLPPLGQGASGTPVLAAGATYTSPWIPIDALTVMAYGFVGESDTGSAALEVQTGNGHAEDNHGPVVALPAGGAGSAFSIWTNSLGNIQNGSNAFARISIVNEGDDIFALSLSLFTVPGLFSENGGGGTPVAGFDWPISNEQESEPTVTVVPDPILGAGDQRWVPFAGEASTIAWGILGDAFPRVVFGSDPMGQGLLFLGDGTADATTHAAVGFVDSTDRPAMVLSGAAGLTGPVLRDRAVTVLAGSDPNTEGTPGEDADVAISDFYLDSTIPGTTYWTVDTPGNPAAWVPFLTFANNDPITAGAVPLALGQLWLNNAAGGAWTSTGGALGDWVQLIGSDTGWIDATPSLVNSWSAADGVARYRRLNGVVFLQLAVAGGTTPIILNSLPLGFEPSVTGATFPVEVQVAGVAQVGVLTVEIGGQVNVLTVAGATPGAVGPGTASVSFPADA